MRAGLTLTGAALRAELDRITDTGTDVIAQRAAGAASCRPWSLVNLLSRLVVDPERFPDERESMNAVGMGTVYTRTSLGGPLRNPDAAAREKLLTRWFHPYAEAMTELVEARLAAVGRVTIVDVHSYPSQRLPYEIGGSERPAICLGTDPAHTPPWLLAAARAAFAASGHDVAVDSPFSGCYLPLRHYGREPDVTGIMIEIRRDDYLIEPAGPLTEGVAAVSRSLARLIDAVTAGVNTGQP